MYIVVFTTCCLVPVKILAIHLRERAQEEREACAFQSARKVPNFTLEDFILVFNLLAFCGGHILSRLVIYFGIPKFLTFGIQIGRILPSSCEASTVIEGPDSFPCFVEWFSGWIVRFASRADGSWHLDELGTPDGEDVFVLLLLFVCCVGSVLFFRWIRLRKEREHLGARIKA